MNTKPQNLFLIALDLPLKQPFTYAAPPELAGRIKTGHRVLAPFRHKKVTGYVLGPDEAGPGGEIREILDLVLPETLVRLVIPEQ